ncbi:MAG: hypothetical protein IT327_28610 [Anaerolineae bacterium]|nr:hypothetical protein [Anaerolineae bacterium]
MIVLPQKIREEISEKVFSRADDYRYLARTRSENSEFLDQLVKDPNIGGVLREYMSREKVKTYIKDSVLNKYSKLKQTLPRNLELTLKPLYGAPIYEVEYRKSDHLSLHRTNDNKLVAVARTKPLKWETGLRKLILFIASSQGLPPSDGTQLDLILAIFQHGVPVNEGDKKLVEGGLKLIGVKGLWVE